jgi:hypothetical protein|tara:strand:+ start:11548 stop:11694 length:147 start_codon:yes stop_codon:yes gene_type:complete
VSGLPGTFFRRYIDRLDSSFAVFWGEKTVKTSLFEDLFHIDIDAKLVL